MRATIKTLLLYTVVLPMVAVVNYAHAIIVFDPSNYAQTTITAVQAVEAQVTRIEQLRNEIRQNLNTFGGSDLAKLKDEYQKITSVYDSAQRLQTYVVGVRNNFDDVKSLFGSGSYSSFEQFTNDIKRRGAAGDAIAKTLYSNSQNATSAMKQAYEQHAKLVDQASSVNGVTEAAQSTTSAVGILIQQNNAILAMMSADQMNKAVEKSEQTTKKTINENKENDYYQRVARELEKIKSGSK